MTEEEQAAPVARARAEVTPPKRTFLLPSGLGVERTPEGVQINFVITPFEAYTVVLVEDDRKELLRQLTGGVIPV